MKSVEFLRVFHPEGFWVLTAIQPDGKRIVTETFSPDKADEAEEWITFYNGKSNLYFSVNQPAKPLSKKANRQDIVTVGWLHVDCDSRPGEDFQEEMLRIKNLLKDPPKGVPTPTFINFSGGGYQAFWRLAEPIATPSQEDAEKVASYNRQLEVVLEGDACSNVDRIMRLPGTTNIPNARKVAKGRVQAEAEVYAYNDLTYPLSDFVAAPMQSVGNDPEVHSTFTPSANIQRLNSVDDLDKWGVTDRVKVIIVQGTDPDNPKETDNSRSAWLFDALCQLARAEVPEEVMYSIITDPDMGIASSVLDKGNNVEKYALKQIRSAMEHAVDPDLHEFNQKYACVMVGGQFRVMHEKFNHVLKRPEVLLLRKTDFQNHFQNRLKDLGDGKKMPLAQWWLGHEKRRQYNEVIFLPNTNVPGAFNLWKGFKYPALPGDKHESYLKHLHDNICQGNDEYYQYLIEWMARAVQKPDRPGEVAVVLRGGSGNGKSFFARHFGALFGPHFLQVGDSRHLTGNFNSHLEGTVVLFSDEAFFAGDPRHKSVLKVLITEETITIERKGIDLNQTANFLHIIIASNDDHLVPSQAKERRFFVLDVGNARQQDNSYFATIKADLQDGGYESLLHFLMKYDIEKYDVRNVPNTQAQSEQKMLSMDAIDSWWMLCLESGKIRKTDTEWHRFQRRVNVLDSFRTYLQEWNIPRRPTPQGLGARLKKMLPEGYPNRNNRKKQEYEFPSLATCRKSFEDYYGMSVEWHEETEYNQDSTEKSPDEPF